MGEEKMAGGLTRCRYSASASRSARLVYEVAVAKGTRCVSPNGDVSILVYAR